jgi:hypothetical protein
MRAMMLPREQLFEALLEARTNADDMTVISTKNNEINCSFIEKSFQKAQLKMSTSERASGATILP